MMKQPTPYLPTLLMTCGVFIVTAVSVNWVVDPLRYFHSPWLDIGFSDNQRFQNPGLIRTESYDTVLIGTSHTEPFYPSAIGKALGGEALNLSVSGSFIKEQGMLLELALREGKVKRVLWEINTPSFLLGDVVAEPASFPDFLFQPSVETPFRYLLSWDTFQESRRAISGQRTEKMDDLARWDRTAIFGEQQVLAHWDFMTQRWTDELRDFWGDYVVSADVITSLVEKYMASLVAQYPDVQFDFILMPSTLLDYINDLQVHEDRLDKRLMLRNEVAALAGRFENAQIWDFQLNEAMVRNLDHYKDIDHFGQSLVTPILDSLSNGDNLTAPEQVIEQTRQLRLDVAVFAQDFCAPSPERCQPVLLENIKEFSNRPSEPVRQNSH